MNSYNFSISNEITEMVDSHSPALLDLFLSSDASICFTMAFPPLGNSDHIFVLVSVEFPTSSKKVFLFHRIAYHFSCADWDSLRKDILPRDVSWENIF